MNELLEPEIVDRHCCTVCEVVEKGLAEYLGGFDEAFRNEITGQVKVWYDESDNTDKLVIFKRGSEHNPLFITDGNGHMPVVEEVGIDGESNYYFVLRGEKRARHRIGDMLAPRYHKLFVYFGSNYVLLVTNDAQNPYSMEAFHMWGFSKGGFKAVRYSTERNRNAQGLCYYFDEDYSFPQALL